MLCERPAEVERGRRQRREKQMKEKSRAGKVTAMKNLRQTWAVAVEEGTH